MLGDVDVVKAASFYEESAKRGYLKAKTQIGEAYLQGRGVIKDVGKARKYLEEAAFAW